MKFEQALWVFKKSNRDLLTKDLPEVLKKFGYDYQLGEKFLYAEGTVPILLVAHVDTVHRTLTEHVFWDKEYNVLWSPVGLGADDRAGVAAIIEILDRGHRPHILFTDEEETGCHGAREAMNTVYPDVKYIIELDRKNSNDSVFYDCDNKKFEAYVNGFGFTTAMGTLSDISCLCPHWGIAGVNLSIGYYNAHTNSEYLVLEEWESTVSKVEDMLINAPNSVFAYEKKKITPTYPKKIISYPYGNYYGTSYGKNYKGKVSYAMDEYEEFYDRVYSTGYNSASSWYKDEIRITMTAADFSDFYGGSIKEWKEWIQENKGDVEDIIMSDILDMAEHVAYDILADEYLDLDKEEDDEVFDEFENEEFWEKEAKATSKKSKKR